MRFDDYVRAARTNAALLLILAVTGCIAGLVLTLTQTPQYRSTASVYIATQQATNLNDLTQGSIFTQQAVKNYASTVPTSLVLAPALASLHIDRSPQSLARAVVVENPLDTTILNISVTDASPVTAARLANAIQVSLGRAVSELTPPTADSVNPVKIIVLNNAVASPSPVSPNAALNAAIGGIVGLAIAVFVALFRNALARREREVSAIERRPDDRPDQNEPQASPVTIDHIKPMGTVTSRTVSPPALQDSRE